MVPAVLDQPLRAAPPERSGGPFTMSQAQPMHQIDQILQQGKALVRATEALDTIEPSGPTETAITWLLLKAYRRRLRAMVATAPAWVSEEILSASERIGDGRAVLWMSKN